MELSDATEVFTLSPPGIYPGTFRLVAQYLNHYATPGPVVGSMSLNEKKSFMEIYVKFELCMEIFLDRCSEHFFIRRKMSY
jgi:hypothetical protein